MAAAPFRRHQLYQPIVVLPGGLFRRFPVIIARYIRSLSLNVAHQAQFVLHSTQRECSDGDDATCGHRVAVPRRSVSHCRTLSLLGSFYHILIVQLRQVSQEQEL